MDWVLGRDFGVEGVTICSPKHMPTVDAVWHRVGKLQGNFRGGQILNEFHSWGVG